MSLHRNTKGSIPEEYMRLPAKKSIRFSASKSIRQSEDEEDTREEFDIDERVTRQSAKRLHKLERPCSASADNSRIFNVLQQYALLDLPRDLEWHDFDTMSPRACIEYLAEVIGCDNHEENMASFWLLDTLSEVLRRGQLKGVINENLSVICLWFLHLIKTISVFAPLREDFFVDVGQMLFEAEPEYLTTGKIPKPREVVERIDVKKAVLADDMKKGNVSLNELLTMNVKIEIRSEYTDPLPLNKTINTVGSVADLKESYGGVESENNNECTTLNELAFLTKQIFYVFGNKFKYEVIKTVFSIPPDIQPLVIVDNMHVPKELGTSQRRIHESNVKKRESKLKIGKTIVENGKKGKIEKEQINLAVEKFKIQLQELDWKRLDEKEKERTKHFYIRPLEDSVNNEYFEKLFPSSDPEINTRQSTIEKARSTPKPKKKLK